MRPYSSADITELIFASTSHVVTTFIFLHPKLALIALLKSTSFNKFHKWFILFLFFKLLTRKALMLFNSAAQTIRFLANLTSKINRITFIVFKHELSVRGRIPTHIWICFSKMFDLFFLEIRNFYNTA